MFNSIDAIGRQTDLNDSCMVDAIEKSYKPFLLIIHQKGMQVLFPAIFEII
jgi:hypothetical protein